MGAKIDHPTFKELQPINPDKVVWKYFTLDKFMDLLFRSSLYFTRADLLEDKLEGASSKYLSDGRLANQTLESKSDVQDQKIAYVNCWHGNEYEDIAMWKIYGDRGVAVQSTYSRLKESITVTEKKSPYIGEVQYIDHTHDCIPNQYGAWSIIFDKFMHKSRCYAFEKEVRLVTTVFGSAQYGTNGLHISINLNKLILKVIISPFLMDWQYKNIVKFVGNFNCKLACCRSDLHGFLNI